MANYDRITKAALDLANGSDDIRALAVMGSSATDSNDEFSDVDLLFVVRDTAPFVESDVRINTFGSYSIGFAERTLAGGIERRFHFADGCEVDMMFIPAGERLSETAEVLRGGSRLLMDRDGELTRIIANAKPEIRSLPTENEYLSLANEYFFHVIWVAKKIARGELWTAAMCVNGYMKELLLRAIEWESLAGDPSRKIYYSGRHLEAWAEKDTRAALSGAFAKYSRESLFSAAARSNKIFVKCMKRCATAIGCEYPSKAGEYAERRLKEITRASNRSNAGMSGKQTIIGILISAVVFALGTIVDLYVAELPYLMNYNIKFFSMLLAFLCVLGWIRGRSNKR